MMKKVMKGIFLTLMFILNNLPNDLRFLPERMKIINFDIWLVDSLFDKKEYLIHIRNLKQALNHRLDLKKVHRIIKFNQKAWLKLRINMDTELRKKKQKMTLGITFWSWWIMQFLENLRKNRDIKFATTEPRRNYLASEPSYHATNFLKNVY